MALGGPGKGPLFRFQDSRFLTRQRLVAKLREVLQEVGLHPEKYTGHNVCIGVATTAAACGIQDSLIKTMGRSESVAYQLYVWIPQEQLAAVAATLAGVCRHSLNGSLVSYNIAMCHITPVHCMVTVMCW